MSMTFAVVADGHLLAFAPSGDEVCEVVRLGDGRWGFANVGWDHLVHEHGWATAEEAALAALVQVVAGQN